MTTATQAEPPSLESLCELSSFVLNSRSAHSFDELSAPAVNGLSLLLASGAEVASLFIESELDVPQAAAEALSEAIRNCTTITSVSIGSTKYQRNCKPLLVDTIVGAIGPSLETFTATCVDFAAFHHDGGEILAAGLERCIGLRELNFSECRFGFKSPVMRLEKLQSLERVNFNRNEMYDNDTEKLVAEIGKLKNLRELSMINQNTGKDCGGSIYKLCSPCLRLLNISCTYLRDKGVSRVVDAFLASGRSPALETLGLSYDEITPTGVEKLTQLLVRTAHLRSLSLAGNKIGESAAALIGNAIKSSGARELASIDIRNCELGPKGVAGLLSPLQNLCMFTSVCTSGSFSGNPGARALAACLEGKAGRLVKLDIFDDRIGSAGAILLAKALRGAYLLSILDLCMDQIGPAGGAAILDALAQPGKRHMREISMRGCGIGNEGAAAAGRFIMNVRCSILALSGNNINLGGVRAIVNALDKVRPLWIKHLVLGDNPIKKVGAEYIAKRVVVPNKTVRGLCLTNIEMECGGAYIIAEAIQKRNRAGPLNSINVGPADCGEYGVKELRKGEALERAEKHETVVHINAY